MSAEAQPEATPSRQKEWWLRALAVFQAPRAVFAALRDQSEEDMNAREEPVLALIVLAGIAGILLAPATGRLLDEDLVRDSIPVLGVLLFLSGAIYGIVTYWVGGAALYVGLRGAGSQGSYRRTRHVFAFSVAPMVLGLVLVWPARLLVYGLDSFRTGGADEGLGPRLFDLASTGFVLWSLGLLVYGLAVVERWRPGRALVAVALALLAVLVLAFPFVVTVASR
ncbi:MAG TPA: Yip1 family protein [Gaiellaceae bacterium]|nr:Yip1 family protein [Gaiellaceae bacterium]